MQTIKSNPKPIPAMVVSSADLLRHTVQSAKATHTAALNLVYSAALYLLSVSHFTDSKDKSYLPKSKAIEFMESEIAKATGVQNRMLANYITAASYLFDTLTKNTTRFGDVLVKLAAAKTAEAGVETIKAWYEAAQGTRIDSMRMFQETMGYKKVAPRGATRPTAENVIERIQNSVGKIETQFVTPEKGKAVVTEKQVAAAIVSKVSSKVTLLIETLNSITAMGDLDAAEKAIQKRREYLLSLTERAQENVKAKVTDKHKAIAAKIKANAKAKNKRIDRIAA